MVKSTTNDTLFMFGATGGLGTEVAKGLVTADGFSAKKAVVRDVTSDKAKTVEAMGWTLVEIKDLTDVAALTDALQGAKTIVSTVSGNDMTKVETCIIEAGKKVGATLFVPSQFGVDYRRWGTEFPFLAGKAAVLEVAKAADVPVLTVFTGFFSDMIFGFFADPEKRTATYVGDGNVKLTWTRRSDIGYVLAKALNDASLVHGGVLAVQGDYMSLNDATKLLGEVLGGEAFDITYMDPQEAKVEEDSLLKLGLEGNVGAFFGAFKLHLLGEPARGKMGGDLHDSYNNYGVKMQTLEEVFKSGVYGP